MSEKIVRKKLNMLEYLVASGLSCYDLVATDPFRRFDTYGQVVAVESVESTFDAGPNAKRMYSYPADSVIISSVYDFPPKPVVVGDTFDPPLIGTIEFGINEAESYLHDNSGTARVCLRRTLSP